MKAMEKSTKQKGVAMKSKKKWLAYIPITGYISVEVEASSEKEAIDAAIEKANWRIVSEDDSCDPMEFECHHHVTNGNVTYAMLNDAYAEERDDDAT